MSKRQERQAAGLSAAEAAEESAGMTLEQVARQGYGLPDAGLLTVGSDRVVAKPVSIFEIFPDPVQPRHDHIPSAVRRVWDGRNTGALFRVWMEMLAEEQRTSYEQVEALIGMKLRGEEVLPAEVYDNPPDSRPAKTGVMERTLMAAVDLAVTINNDGLNHPIEIIRSGEIYLIQFGERRWLAHHLLYLATNDDKWARIPAIPAKKKDVWRQASENSNRADLNAIGKARQLAILLMDVYSDPTPDPSPNSGRGASPFLPYETFDHEREYYAQVADGQRWRIPRGMGERFMTAMGLKDPQQLRAHRSLLTLSNEIWTLADDYNLSENWLRETRKSVAGERLFYSLALQEATKQGYTVAATTVAARDELPVEEETPHPLTPSPLHGEGEYAYPPNPSPYTERGEENPKSWIHEAQPVSAPPAPEDKQPNAPAANWVERYKLLKKSYPSTALLVVKLGNESILLREDAKAADRLLAETKFRDKYHVINTEHGIALFLSGSLILDELRGLHHVISYAEEDDQEGLHQFFYRHMVVNRRQKPVSAPPPKVMPPRAAATDQEQQIRRLLMWAHQRANEAVQSGKGTVWFNARGVGRMTDWLNDLITRGLLEGKSDRVNTNDGDLFYRISAAGCEHIGWPTIEYPPEPRKPVRLAGAAERRAADVLLALDDVTLEEAREKGDTGYILAQVDVMDKLLARVRAGLETE